jgi:NNP family nitrate/nitrite transporter-like MFS transporter
MAALYGLVYLKAVDDTPSGVPFQKARKAAALEVTSPAAVRGLVALSVPLAVALGVIAWRIWKVGVISSAVLGVAIAASVALLAIQIAAVLKVNGPARRNAVRAEEHYPFRSVAVLSLAYMCTFGSELAAVSFLPEFFEKTWGLSTTVAGAAASTFAIMNLVSRPTGGLVSDVVRSRRRWLAALLAGLAVGFAVASRLNSGWPVGGAIALVLGVSLFAQAGNGAVYAIVPLVKKRVSGQIAGMCGAYGNVGGIMFLTVLIFFSPQVLFLVMGSCALLATLACRWLVEPAGSHTGVLAGLPATSDVRPLTPEPVLATTGSA